MLHETSSPTVALKPYDGAMLVASGRSIERVPCLFIGLLADSGKLTLPSPPMPGARGFREPSVADIAALTWLVQWEGPKMDGHGVRPVAGAVAYIDRYDFHTASDVRSIEFLTGTPRAVRDLVEHLRDGDRRLVGLVDESNVGLKRLLCRMGAKPTRMLIEDQR